MGTRCADHVTLLYPQKLALISPTGGGRSVGIVCVRTKATEKEKKHDTITRNKSLRSFTSSVSRDSSLVLLHCHKVPPLVSTLSQINPHLAEISGFLREVDENCTLRGYYAVSSGNSLPTFRDNLSTMFREIAAAFCLILGFRHQVNKNCALLGYHAVRVVIPNSGQPIGPIFKDLEYCWLRNNREEHSSQTTPSHAVPLPS